MLHALHGENPTRLQLVATYGLSVAAAAMVLTYFGFGWRVGLLALIAADWAGGVVANSAESTRAWWRDKEFARAAFYTVHILEVPLVWWLAAQNQVLFLLLVLILVAKLAVFALGKNSSVSQASN